MASIYKPLGSQDIVSTRTLLHEAIPLTGSIVSGSYSEENIKNYAHGMFQSVYDYPYLSSSANHIFDITSGFSSDSAISSSVSIQQAKKANIYNQMAQVLMGYDKNGNIQKFDADGDLTGGKKINEAIFVTFSRLLVKDEIKKETFQLELGISGSQNGLLNKKDRILIQDTGAKSNYRINSPVGEYGILYATNQNNAAGVMMQGLNGNHADNIGTVTTPKFVCGLIYYQAGVIVLTSSVFMGSPTYGVNNPGFLSSSVTSSGPSSQTLTSSMKVETISASCDTFRNRLYNVQFNNTIELNSTIHFCRINHNEFNYSSNPTYLSGSNVRVVQSTDDNAISYITSVGLYSSDNQLLAVGKLSEPIRKDPSIELTFRSRLDY